MQRFLRLTFLAGFVLLSGLTALSGNKNKEVEKDRGLSKNPSVLSSEKLSSTVVFQEGFNGATFPPAGWTSINRDGSVAPDTSWYQSVTTPGPYEGAAFAADIFASANNFYIDDYLITPNTGASVPAGTKDTLTFWLVARLSTSGNFPDSLDIRVSTTGKDTSNFTTRLAYVLAPKTVWTRFAFILPDAVNRYIAFRYLHYDGGPNGGSSDKIGLDDVRINRFTPTGVGDQNVAAPQSFALKQNFPNPFNPSTQIDFQMKNEALTTLKVYDVLGREVATLANEQLAAGSYSRTFDAKGLTSGVYFYRLIAGSCVETRQMLLVM